MVQPTDAAKKIGSDQVEGLTPDFVSVADFGALGNSTDDTQALQNAIDSASRIYIPKGTYTISKPLIKSSGKLVIIADSAIIRLSPSFPKQLRNYTGAFVLNDLIKIYIKGLTIDGNRANLTDAGPNWKNYIMGIYADNCTDILINHCNVVNSPSISYALHNCSDSKIFNCTSKNGMYHGVEINNCTNATVEDFTYIGIGNQGTDVEIGGIGIVAAESNFINIIHCYIQDSPDTGTKTEGCNNVVWNGNTVTNSGKDGIKFQNLAGNKVNANVTTVYHAKIINNIVDKIFNGRSDGSSLIQVWNAQDVLVSNNNITGGIKTGYEAGILVWATNGETKDVVVSFNRIQNTNKFIYLSYVSGVQVESNICENKLDPVSTGGSGFEAEVSHNFTVTKNVFKRHGTTVNNGSGVDIYNCNDFIFSHNSVINASYGLAASFTNSQSIDISNNNWDNFGTYFASLGVNSSQAIQNLLLNNNTISHVGAGNLLFKIATKNLTLKKLNLTSTKVNGNGSNNRWALEVGDGGTITETDLTNFSTNGNALYPQTSALKGCTRIIGWKSAAPPRSGTWAVGDIVYNLYGGTSTSGWICIQAGSPGSWTSVP